MEYVVSNVFVDYFLNKMSQWRMMRLNRSARYSSGQSSHIKLSLSSLVRCSSLNVMMSSSSCGSNWSKCFHRLIPMVLNKMSISYYASGTP